MNIFKRHQKFVSSKDFYPPIIIRLIKGIMRKMGYRVLESQINNYFIHPIILEHLRKLKTSAQYCEDLLIYLLLDCKEKGFYVDIGANNPSELSNTEFFYNRGWNGINIEPDPLLYEVFKVTRDRDINLNIGIGNQNQELDFYRLSANTLSTFSNSAANQYVRDGHKIIDIIKIPVIQLREVFEHYAIDKQIDFMSIDVEGYELEVLNSNDWEKYRPKIILLEVNQNPKDLLSYFDNYRYELVFNNQTNALFVDLNTKLQASSTEKN